MTVRTISDGPVEVLACACPKCGYALEFTFEDAKSHSTDCDGDVTEDKGLYIRCPRSTCHERTWIGRDRADARARCGVQRRPVVIVTDAHVELTMTAPTPMIVHIPRVDIEHVRAMERGF